jgi:hypothetical protein
LFVISREESSTFSAASASVPDRSLLERTIRKHYGVSILDFSDEITRRTLPTLGPTLPPAVSNVVKLTKR